MNSDDAQFSGSRKADTQNSETPQPANSEHAMNEFVILSKNTRGLNDDRLEELHEELGQVKNWDVLVLSETWRKPKNELFKLHSGHTFMNCGCDAGRRGVGFVLHKRWAGWLKSFEPINERVACLTLQKYRFKIKIVGVYFPHCGYPDDAVQQIYDILQNILETKRREHLVIAGDFNAEIGIRQVIDNQKLIGSWSIGEQNYRGFMLKRWCELNDLSIANTLYPKTARNITTYVGPNKLERQIDFVLLSRKTRKMLRNAGSTGAVDLGSDHKTVEVFLEIARQKQRCRRQKRPKTVAWKSVNGDAFRSKTDELARCAELSADMRTRCEAIENILLEATASSSLNEIHGIQDSGNARDEILCGLLERRRTLGTGTAEKTEISKQIQRHLRKSRRKKQHEKISETLREFRDIRRILNIKTVQKKKLIVQMADSAGSLRTDRKAIADIFADFYEVLYSSHHEAETIGIMHTDPVPPFTMAELTDALKRLKNRKCADTAGIRAEMLKMGGEYLLTKLLELYNMILTGNMQPPSSWKHSVISVIYKSGDATQPQNYRPICIIPVLYKVFAKLMYKRLYPILDKAQCRDQAGFRNKYSTVDHLFVFTMLQEKSEEFNLNSWVAAIDFKKAFDSINQNYLWCALQEQQVPSAYIDILRSLYFDQSAQVRTDVLSRKFGIQRGTKQGDPLSSLLFNALLEKVMSKVKAGFKQQKYGIQMGFGHLETADDTRLTNLRFADDVLVTGRSLQQLSNMLLLLQAESSISGLQLHPEKTKILSSTNRGNRPGQKHVRVGDMKIEILARGDKIKYLGKQITFENGTQVELSNRIKAAWAKFMQYKQELTKKTYSLSDRLRLFESVVSPTVLYGSEAWTLTAEMTRLLRTTQRRMLRAVLGQGRRRMQTAPETPDDRDDTDSEDPLDAALEEDRRDELEPWLDWVKRVTHNVENSLQRLGIKTWVEQARKRKWKWAAELFTGLGEQKWSHIALEWNPQEHCDARRSTARRKPTRPNARWTDELCKFSKERLRPEQQWSDVCSNPDFWKMHENDFINRDVN